MTTVKSSKNWWFVVGGLIMTAGAGAASVFYAIRGDAGLLLAYLPWLATGVWAALSGLGLQRSLPYPSFAAYLVWFVSMALYQAILRAL